MFLVLRNELKNQKQLDPNTHKQINWQPNCNRQALQARAVMLEDIRAFFKARDVLEVETPLLCANAATDLHIQAIPALYSSNTHSAQRYFLQTSPEFAMKRLLAGGSGSIYQLCKAFRNSERGHRHNPEFSMLEWYRLGFDHHQLMDEVDEFLQRIIGCGPAIRFSYQALFLHYLNIDPHSASLEDLKALALVQEIHLSSNDASVLSKDDWLDLLMTHCIEPQLKTLSLKAKAEIFQKKTEILQEKTASTLSPVTYTPVIIYDYPESQAALAKIRPATATSPAVAERFEVYIEGVELANGYHELSDADLQLQRFQEDNAKRLERNLETMEPDLRLVQALKAGFPNCAGVALGIDRLLMLKENYQSIDEVLSFTIERA